MTWEKIQITTENGEKVKAQAPVIISASRSTDIPAFYSDWFFHRLEKGYLKWRNPFNGVPLYVSFAEARLIVFWSKNPEPIMKYLHILDEKKINYYFQFTLNDYEKDGLEENVPPLEKRIDTFIKLSNRIGKERVIWRFDPYILTDEINIEELLKRTKYIGDRLKDYTNKLVFSFADIEVYKKVKNNLNREHINYKEFDKQTMNQLAKGLMELNKEWNFEIGTCSEKIDLEKYGINHNKCIDDDLIKKLFSDDYELMRFLGFEKKSVSDDYELTRYWEEKHFSLIPISKKQKNLKDKGQRQACGCIVSKDIGQYNTCPHKCVYCYANTSKEIALKNYRKYKLNPNSETIIGE